MTYVAVRPCEYVSAYAPSKSPSAWHCTPLSGFVLEMSTIGATLRAVAPTAVMGPTVSRTWIERVADATLPAASVAMYVTAYRPHASASGAKLCD